MCSVGFPLSLDLPCESELFNGKRQGAAEDIPGNFPGTPIVWRSLRKSTQAKVTFFGFIHLYDLADMDWWWAHDSYI